MKTKVISVFIASIVFAIGYSSFLKLKSELTASPLSEKKIDNSICEKNYKKITSESNCQGKADVFTLIMRKYPQEDCDTFRIQRSPNDPLDSLLLKESLLEIARCYLDENLSMDAQLEEAFNRTLALEPWWVERAATADNSHVLIRGLREKIKKEFNVCRTLDVYVNHIKSALQHQSLEKFKELVLSENNFNFGAMESDNSGVTSISDFVEVNRTTNLHNIKYEEKKGFFKIENWNHGALFLLPIEYNNCIYLEGAYEGRNDLPLFQVIEWKTDKK